MKMYKLGVNCNKLALAIYHAREVNMDDYLKEALEIVKAQASVRNMTEDEITSMVMKLASGIKGICEGSVTPDGGMDAQAAQRSIKEKTISCLECGKSFKIITKKHLALHDLDAVSYREKWGFKKNTPLVCKSLQRERRKKMKDMQLWEKRRKQPAE
ncbi:transcriptional regulator, MucR family [Oleidesulfovibrio alaskensis G20]|uniref:Transcriptional regulator, MucR family n=2 Tax=Oleidesulfovibrio alaskensis TaxID=58180 RepID=Q30Y37_OLEA2|nr:transcriptional regulator, MucR family [Oleidesulfovibrio alaskensis G20]